MPPDPFAALHDAITAFRHRQLFFIGGLPKSGTTWLQLLLDAHPAISCRGEGHFCTSLQPLLETALQQHNGLLHLKSADILDGAAALPRFSQAHSDYLLSAAVALLLAESAGAAPIIGEKTPDNVFNMPRLQALFPAARFIIIVRDGRDCVVSAWFHNRRLNPEAAAAQFPDFAAFAGYVGRDWAAGIEAGEKFTRANPATCLTITYESLLRAPAAALANVFGFLGADNRDAVVRRCVEAADFTRLTGGRLPGQEDRSSLFRRGVAGDWQLHFDAAARTAFEAAAGHWLRHFGYQEARAAA